MNQWPAKLLLPVIFISLSGISCSNLSSESGDGVGGIQIPQFQKGLSDQDYAEFRQRMDQFQMVHQSLGQLPLNYGLFDRVIADLNTYKGSPQPSNNQTISPPEDYRGRLQASLANCESRSRTEKGNIGQIESVSGKLAPPSNSTLDCKTQASWGNRSESTSIGRTESIGNQNEGLSFSLESQSFRFREGDMIKLTTSLAGTASTKRASRPFDDPSTSSSNVRIISGYLTRKGQGGDFEVQRIISTSEVKVDDGPAIQNSSSSIVFVFRGTSNPVVYVRSDKTENSVTQTKIELNGEVIYQSKP